MTNYIIDPSEIRQEAVGLCNEFAEFFRNFANELNAIPAENTDEIVSVWNRYFVDHNRTTLRLIKVKMAMEQFEGEEPNTGLVANLNTLIEEKCVENARKEQ